MPMLRQTRNEVADAHSGNCWKMCSSRIAGVHCVQRQTREVRALPLGVGVRLHLGRELHVCVVKLLHRMRMKCLRRQADKDLQHRAFLGAWWLPWVSVCALN
jgi:hypothetical protein